MPSAVEVKAVDTATVRGEGGMRILQLIAVGFCLMLSTLAIAARPDSLRTVLDTHLAAINARDLDALLSTVTTGEKLTLILPNGKVLRTREEYRKLHVEWFGESDWRMQFDVDSLQEFGDVGVALVKYRSQSKQADGSYETKREAWLSLTFAKEKGRWHLVYDQNTVIPAAAN
ncbi:MAG: nuclear transport factor 2 family protein [Dokdonella sp.]